MKRKNKRCRRSTNNLEVWQLEFSERSSKPRKNGDPHKKEKITRILQMPKRDFLTRSNILTEPTKIGLNTWKSPNFGTVLISTTSTDEVRRKHRMKLISTRLRIRVHNQEDVAMPNVMDKHEGPHLEISRTVTLYETASRRRYRQVSKISVRHHHVSLIEKTTHLRSIDNAPGAMKNRHHDP